MPESSRNGNTVPMVGRVLAVLEIFHARGPQLSLNEVVDITSIPKASTFRILETLRDEGYLTKNSGGRYRLTYKLFDIAMGVQQRNPLRRISLPYLHEIRTLHGATVNLGVQQGDHVVYTDVLESAPALCIISAVGLHAPMHASALGKVIAATLPPAELQGLIARTGLPRFTKNTITTEGAFAADLAQTRKRGFGVDEEEDQPGNFCVAVPILRSGNQPVCAISCCAPVARMNRERIARFVEHLTSAGKAISGQF